MKKKYIYNKGRTKKRKGVGLESKEEYVKSKGNEKMSRRLILPVNRTQEPRGRSVSACIFNTSLQLFSNTQTQSVLTLHTSV